MSVNPKTLVEKFIRDSKGRSRLAAVTGVLAVFTVLITVGVLTFPAISISGSEEALREQGIDITTGQQQQEAEVVAPPADEAPMVVYDEASQAADAESSENVAEAITEETTVGDVVVSEEADLAADAPVEGEAIEATDVEAEGETEAEAEEELDPEKAEAEEKVEASDAAKAALATADLSSSRLIIGTSNADALAEETNVVASFDNIYLLQYASAEEAAKGFLRYFDIADYVTPDVAVEVADDSIEDNSDPEEEVITTDNVYTEETNPFVELEVAIEENQAEIEAEATKQDALIAVIDTGAALEGNVIESVSMLGENGADDNGHGQRMVDYVVEENENARILSIKALGADGKGDVSAVVAAFNYAIERGANIINLSASAYASEENAALVDVVKRAEEAGIIVVGSAGNNGFNAKFYIPGNIPEATIVGASDDKGQRIKQSNFGETVDYNFWAGSTSEAAARMSGFVSANGEDGVAAVLNQGRIFSTDYIAAPAEEEVVEGEPAEGEEAVEGEGEETPDEANRDTDFVAQAVVSQLIKLQPAGEISVLKVDENKVPLAGAKLAIVKKSDLNNYVKQWTSSASPMVFSTDDFEEGVEYQVFEIEPPFGYERNENVAYPTFTVRKNHSSQAANGSLSHPGVSVTHSTVKGSYIQLSKSGKTNIGYCVSMHNHYLTTTSSTDAVLLDDATSEFFNSNTTVSNKPGGRVNVNENMLKAIKHALYIGYPNDSANLLGKNLISEKDFYKVTQAVIWHYTTNGGFDSLSASYDNTWNTNWSGWYQGIFEARSTNANSWYQRIIRYIDALVAGNTNATLDGVNASGFGAPDSFKVNLFKFGSDQPVVETYPTEQVIPPLQLENKLRKGKITITKQWANEDGSSVSIPVDSVDVQLTRSVDGVPDDNFSQVITITKANNWVATQDGLDLVDSKTMKPYQYSISENTNVAGFSAIVTGPTTVETSKVTYNVATTSSSATWNATTYLSNNDTFVFTRSGDSKVLTVDGNSVKWVNLSGSSAANAPAEAQWKAILANSNNSSYYLQNVKTGKYLKLGNRVGNNGQSYWSYYYDCTGTTSNAERFRLVNYSSSYYSGSYALQGVTATSNSNGYGIEISTVDGQLSYYNTAYVKPYKKNVTSDTSTNQQDLYTEFEATVVNAGVKHDFELLKIDSSKLNSLPNSIDSLDSITDIDGLDGAVFTLKNNNEGDNKDAYLTKDNTWKNTTNKDAEVRFTTEDGKVSFGGLLAGSYILEEVQVPEHYVQAEGLLWNVTVKNDGTIEVETHANAVKDKFVVFGNAAAIVIGNDIQTYVLPATGGIGTTVFVIGGALLMLLAAALFVRRGAKKEA